MKNIPLEQIMTNAKACDKKIKVKDVAELIEGSYAVLYNEGTILKEVEKKIGDADYNVLITSLLGTFMSTIYANANFKNIDKMVEYGKNVNASKIFGVKSKR